MQNLREEEKGTTRSQNRGMTSNREGETRAQECKTKCKQYSKLTAS